MRLIRGMSALLLLVSLIVGAPIALATWGAPFLPDHLPSTGEIQAWFSSPDLGGTALFLLIIAGWVAWITLTISVLLEIPAQLRGRGARQLPAFALPQKTAHILVAAVLAMLIMTPTIALADNATARVPTSLSVTATQVPTETGSTPAATAVTAPESTNQITVQAGDSLWSLAEKYLGDGMKYRDIVAANEGIQQPDGAALTTRSTVIHPGWKLTVPTAKPTPTPSASTVIVQPGDNLSDIAQKTLGDENQWPTIYNTNVGKAQADGQTLTNPDVIEPGWILDVPGLAGAAVPSVLEPSQSAGAAVPSVLEPSQSAGAAVPSVPEAPQSAPSSAPSLASAPAKIASTDTSVSWEIATLAGAVLAGSVVAALGWRRMIQQRRRRPGHVPSLPQSLAPIELQMRAVDDPSSVVTIDKALRSIALSYRRAGEVMPSIAAARMSTTDLWIQPLLAAEPMAPFVADGQWWRLNPADAAFTDDPDASDLPAPLPTLVTLGRSSGPDEMLYMIDLECAGAILLDGDHRYVEGALTAMAIELATASWADHLEIHHVGFGAELDGVFSDRLRYSADLSSACDALERRNQQIKDALALDGLGSVHEARTRTRGDDAWHPAIILTTEPMTGPHLKRITDLVSDAPNGAIAAVIASDGEGSGLSTPWLIQIGSDAAAQVAPLETDLVLQRVSRADVAQLIDTFALTERPDELARSSVPAEPVLQVHYDRSSWESATPFAASAAVPLLLPAAALRESPAESSDDEDGGEPSIPVVYEMLADGPEIAILGQPQLNGAGGTEPDGRKQKRLVELAAFLAFNPKASSETISRRMGTDDREWTPSTRQSSLSRLRSWLGDCQSGEPYLPTKSSSRGYELHEGVRCDWVRFEQLAHRGVKRGSARIDDLERALRLVRDRPFAGVAPDRYGWAEVHRQLLISHIVDVVHTLADHYVQIGAFSKGRIALHKGLYIEPSSELLYRDLFRLEHRAGNRPAIDVALKRLNSTNAACGVDMETETAQLLEILLDPARAAVAGW